MGLIKRFLDFISSKNETKPKVENTLLNYEEVNRLFLMVKDYCTFNDIEGVSITWPTCEDENGIAYMSYESIFQATKLYDYITKLEKFSFEFQMKIDRGTNNDLLRSEVDSAKRQLQAEDFNLIWNKRDYTPKKELEDGSVEYERYDKIIIKHKSFIEEKPIYWKK
jgi:hypothetical protein